MSFWFGALRRAPSPHSVSGPRRGRDPAPVEWRPLGGRSRGARFLDAPRAASPPKWLSRSLFPGFLQNLTSPVHLAAGFVPARSRPVASSSGASELLGGGNSEALCSRPRPEQEAAGSEDGGRVPECARALRSRHRHGGGAQPGPLDKQR